MNMVVPWPAMNLVAIRTFGEPIQWISHEEKRRRDELTNRAQTVIQKHANNAERLQAKMEEMETRVKREKEEWQKEKKEWQKEKR